MVLVLSAISSARVARFALVALIGIIELLALFNALSLSQINSAIFVNRITYIVPFNSTVFQSPLVDSIISLSSMVGIVLLTSNSRRILLTSLPAIVVWMAALLSIGEPLSLFTPLLTLGSLFYITVFFWRKHQVEFKLSPGPFKLVEGIILILSALAAASISVWIIYATLGGRVNEGPLWHLTQLQALINGALAWLIPTISLIMVDFFLVRRFSDMIIAFSKSRLRLLSERAQLDSLTEASFFAKHSRGILLGTMMASLAFALFPYLPTINPQLLHMGVDLPYYIEWISEMEQFKDPFQILHYAFVDANGGDRPLPIILLHVMTEIGIPSDKAVIFFIPAISPVLVFVVYHVTKNLSKRIDLAALVAIFTTTSHQLIVGTYGGFIANYLALLGMYMSIYYAIRTWNDPSLKPLVMAILFSTFTLFSHVYTFTYLIAAMGVFAALSIASERRSVKRKSLIYFVSFLAISIATDMLKTYALGSAGGIERDLTLPENYVGLDQYTYRWGNLVYSFVYFHGGLFAFTIGFFAILIWLMAAKYNNVFERMIMSTIFVGSLPFLFGNYTIQSRILYDMPLQIGISLGVLVILSNNTFNKNARIIGFAFFFLVAVEFALRGMSNLFFKAPS